MSKVKTVKEVIQRLEELDPNESIAINWWIKDDFEEYEDTDQAIQHAQDYLSNLNPEIQSYVDMEY